MYHDVKRTYRWNNMKREIATYVSKCLTCQKVKIEHQRPAGELQPLPIPEWKWENITMDFLMGLPTTRKGHNAVWIVVDRLTKSSHFLPMKESDTVETLARLYVREIVRLHGVPISIVSDRDARFTSKFWQALQRALGTKLEMSTAFHPQTDGQSERVVQIVEDMLRACILDFQGSWDVHLPLCEFAYNNSYQASIRMAPYEALYGRPCRSPMCWVEAGETALLGPQLVEETTEKIRIIKDHLKTAQSRQKSYADRRRRPLEFEVGDLVFLKVKAHHGFVRFGCRGKLAPRYIGPFEILKRVGSVSYQLSLPPSMERVHDVFHVSLLRKYLHDPSHVIPVDDIVVDKNATYKTQPVKILDTKVQELRNKTIGLVKVLWLHHNMEEATWELESEIRRLYPHLFE